jgi:hypothetical protein
MTSGIWGINLDKWNEMRQCLQNCKLWITDMSIHAALIVIMATEGNIFFEILLEIDHKALAFLAMLINLKSCRTVANLKA